jgi:hypothetical protein
MRFIQVPGIWIMFWGKALSFFGLGAFGGGLEEVLAEGRFKPDAQLV